MTTVQKTYLQFIEFLDVSNWSVQYLKWTAFSYNKDFELVKIWDFLLKNNNLADIEDNIEYKRVTVKMNNKWVTLRDTELWKNIGTKRQFIVQGWEFIMSKIDARNGAFWIIPAELHGAIVTNDFPTFRINTTKLNPEFFVFLTSTSEFLGFARTCSSGTTGRQRINMDQFLNVKIPLPSLEEQNKIVASYNLKIQESTQSEFRATELERNIERYLMEELGIDGGEKSEKKGGLRFVEFRELSRWDLSKNLSSWRSNIYKNILFKDIILWEPMYWANVSWVDKISDTRYIRITDINESWDLNNNFISPESVEEKFLLKEDDFLIARSWNTVWKTFLYKSIYGRSIFAWYLVKYIFDKKLVVPEFVLLYTKWVNFKKWIEWNQRIAWQPNINGQEYLYSPFILPPLEIQEEIVKHITEMKDEIKRLKKLAEDLRESAKVEFEKEIFS